MFLGEFLRLGLVQCITSPTHNKGKILDILLTNSENHLSNISIISDQQFCKSDHFGISFDVKFKIERKRPIKIKSFNFKRANWDILNEELKSINWVSVLDSLEPDIAWLRFKDTLNYYLDLYIPKITMGINSKPPWFDVDCYQKCREKERLLKKYKRTKTMHDELKFVKCRREFKSMIRSKMRDNLFQNSDSNAITKQFWSYVKSKSKSSRIPEIVKHNNVISSDNVTKANMFNKYFFEQFSSSSTYDIDIDFSQDNLFDIDFSCSRIKDLLENINVNEAPGPDGIHGCILKYCSTSLCRPLSILFKLIYNTGTIPVEWKSANIIPIHKEGDNATVSNYRPISLICITFKIMERIIQQELFDRYREMLNPIQHGFLPNRSCATNLINLTDNIVTNLYKGIGADIIYFDFAKAFDTVNHDLLINKLKNNSNIDGRLLKFITNYLKDQRQRVGLDNIFSDFQHVQSGVPQGSILGPLLFTLFINDIDSGISTDTNICLFADDTKIWRPMETEHDCAILQKTLNASINGVIPTR